MIKLYKNQTITLFFILVFSSFSTFAVSLLSDGEEDIIWKSGVNQYIKYAKQDDSKFGKNDHPVELEAKDIRLALKALQYTEKTFLKGEHLKSIFSVSQINILSKQIAKGLRHATLDQDIIFVLQGSEKELIVLTKKFAVAGRIFYNEGKLNIILGEHDLARNDAFEKAYDPGGQRELPYNFNHGRRSRDSNRFTGALLGIPGVDNKRIDNDLRQDWILIDVKVASAGYIAKTSSKENAVNAKIDRKLQEEAAKLAKQRREMRAEMARMRKQVKNIENNNEPVSVRSIEERMAMLDQLLGKKLITQEEYDSKRQDILNDI